MDSRDDIEHKKIADAAGRVAQVVKIGKIAANAAKVVLPQTIKVIGKGAGIVKEAAQDPSSSSETEKLICAYASEIVKGVIATPFVAAAGTAGAVGGPVGSAIAAGAVSAIVVESAKPVGKVAQTMCHTVFDRLKGREKAGICVADALRREISNKNTSLNSSIIKMAHSGQAAQQFMAPVAKSFLTQNDSKSEHSRSITPLLATAIGFHAGTAMAQLGNITETSPNTLLTKTGKLTYKVAEVSTKEIDKSIENSAYLNEWATLAARDFYKDASKQNQLTEEIFDKALNDYARTYIKTIFAQNVTVDEKLIFGRALQKGLENEWPNFVNKKFPRKSSTSITTNDIIGDLKRIKTQIKKADLHKQVRESVVTVNTTDQDIDRLLIDLLTDIDIKGFEHDNNIKSLKAKLDEHKKSQHSTPLKILRAAQKLNVAKAKAAEEENKKEEYIKNAHYCVDIASNAAYLLGNNKRAQQISVIGNALINVASVMTPMGAMNPLAVASTLLGACSSIKSLFSRHKGQDSSRIILEALQALGEQLQNLQKEMHERFDQVMATLDDMNRNMVRGFLKLDWKADHIIEQIQALRGEIDHLAEQQANTGATVIEELDDLQKSTEQKSLDNEVTKIFTLAENAKRDSDQYKYSHYVTEIDTHALASNVGAKHIHIVGNHTSIKGNDLTALRKLVKDNHLQHRSGYASLNTLLNYFDNLNFGTDYHYQPKNVNYLVGQLVKSNQDLACAPTLGLGNLLIDEPDRKDSAGTAVISLRKTMESMDAAIQLIPIQSNGTWHLLVIDTRQETFHYYGIADQLTLNRLFAALDTIEGYEHWRHKTHATVLTELGPQATALLVIKQCGEIAEQSKVSLTLTKSEAAQLDTNNVSILKADYRYPQNYTTPAHPLIWKYLSHALNTLVIKQYPDVQRASLSTDEIARFQRFIDEGNHILSQLQRLRNPEFIQFLIEKYEEAANTLSEELEMDRARFEKDVSKKITAESKLVLGNALFDMSALQKQKIDVSTDYATAANGGKWFYTTATEMNLKKGPTGLNSGAGLNDHTGGDIRAEYKSAYKSARMDDINTKRDIFVSQVEEDQKQEIYHYATDLYEKWTCSPHLSVMLVPIAKGLPVLPMPRNEACFSILPDIYCHAQILGLGQIKCAYKIVGNKFILSAHFVQQHSPNPNKQNKISSITIPYDPSFYQGSEAVWWWWMGGNFCDNLQNVSSVSIPWTRYAGGYCGHVRMYKSILAPVCTEHKGLYHDLDDHLKNVKFYDTDMQQQITTQISKIFEGLRADWHEKVRHTIASDRSSPLGKAAETFDACATLLSLISEMALADKNQLDLFTQLMNEYPAFAFNLNGLHTILETCPDNNIATMIAPKAQTMELLTNALSFLQKMRWKMDFPLFEDPRVIVELLQCMDEYVPKMKKGLTISQKDAFHQQLLEVDSYVVGAYCQGFKALQIADAAERRKRDQYVAELEQFRKAHSEIRERINSGAPESTLTLIGYPQHGLLRSPVHVQNMEEKSTINLKKSGLSH